MNSKFTAAIAVFAVALMLCGALVPLTADNSVASPAESAVITNNDYTNTGVSSVSDLLSSFLTDGSMDESSIAGFLEQLVANGSLDDSKMSELMGQLIAKGSEKLQSDSEKTESAIGKILSYMMPQNYTGTVSGPALGDTEPYTGSSSVFFMPIESTVDYTTAIDLKDGLTNIGTNEYEVKDNKTVKLDGAEPAKGDIYIRSGSTLVMLPVASTGDTDYSITFSDGGYHYIHIENGAIIDILGASYKVVMNETYGSTVFIYMMNGLTISSTYNKSTKAFDASLTLNPGSKIEVNRMLDLDLVNRSGEANEAASAEAKIEIGESYSKKFSDVKIIIDSDIDDLAGKYSERMDIEAKEINMVPLASETGVAFTIGVDTLTINTKQFYNKVLKNEMKDLKVSSLNIIATMDSWYTEEFEKDYANFKEVLKISSDQPIEIAAINGYDTSSTSEEPISSISGIELSLDSMIEFGLTEEYKVSLTSEVNMYAKGSATLDIESIEANVGPYTISVDGINANVLNLDGTYNYKNVLSNDTKKSTDNATTLVVKVDTISAYSGEFKCVQNAVNGVEVSNEIDANKITVYCKDLDVTYSYDRKVTPSSTSYTVNAVGLLEVSASDPTVNYSGVKAVFTGDLKIGANANFKYYTLNSDSAYEMKVGGTAGLYLAIPSAVADYKAGDTTVSSVATTGGLTLSIDAAVDEFDSTKESPVLKASVELNAELKETNFGKDDLRPFGIQADKVAAKIEGLKITATIKDPMNSEIDRDFELKAELKNESITADKLVIENYSVIATGINESIYDVTVTASGIIPAEKPPEAPLGKLTIPEYSIESVSANVSLGLGATVYVYDGELGKEGVKPKYSVENAAVKIEGLSLSAKYGKIDETTGDRDFTIAAGLNNESISAKKIAVVMENKKALGAAEESNTITVTDLNQRLYNVKITVTGVVLGDEEPVKGLGDALPSLNDLRIDKIDVAVSFEFGVTLDTDKMGYYADAFAVKIEGVSLVAEFGKADEKTGDRPITLTSGLSNESISAKKIVVAGYGTITDLDQSISGITSTVKGTVSSDFFVSPSPQGITIDSSEENVASVKLSVTVSGDKDTMAGTYLGPYAPTLKIDASDLYAKSEKKEIKEEETTTTVDVYKVSGNISASITVRYDGLDRALAVALNGVEYNQEGSDFTVTATSVSASCNIPFDSMQIPGLADMSLMNMDVSIDASELNVAYAVPKETNGIAQISPVNLAISGKSISTVTAVPAKNTGAPYLDRISIGADDFTVDIKNKEMSASKISGYLKNFGEDDQNFEITKSPVIGLSNDTTTLIIKKGSADFKAGFLPMSVVVGKDAVMVADGFSAVNFSFEKGAILSGTVAFNTKEYLIADSRTITYDGQTLVKIEKTAEKALSECGYTMLFDIGTLGGGKLTADKGLEIPEYKSELGTKWVRSEDHLSATYDTGNGAEFKFACDPLTYKLTYSTDGEVKDVKFGDTVTLSKEVPAKEGYSALGWNDGDSITIVGSEYKMPARNVTLSPSYACVAPDVTKVGEDLKTSMIVDGKAAETVFVAKADMTEVGKEGSLTIKVTGATVQMDKTTVNNLQTEAEAKSADYSLILTVVKVTDINDEVTAKIVGNDLLYKIDLTSSGFGDDDKFTYANGETFTVTITVPATGNIEGFDVSYISEEYGVHAIGIIDYKDNGDGTWDVTFECNHFSNYMIVPIYGNPGSETNTTGLIVALIIIAVMAAWMIFMNVKKDKKDAQ